MPSLAKLPSLTSIWQRPQMPRPPHTESMSTPRLRAAVSTGVPQAKRPRRPDGMKAISALGLALSSVTAKRRPLDRKKLYHRDTESTESTEEERKVSSRLSPTAKAGIHPAGNSLVDRWIPAFAGMTSLG